MKKKFFGTDGIRGKTNESFINEEFLSDLAIALTLFFGRQKGAKKRLVIGKDTRLSGYMIESIMCGIFLSRGWDCIPIGVIPTSAISSSVKVGKFDFGVMISASHNSYEDNGIKIFNKHGEKLNDNDELEIENIIESEKEKLLCKSSHIGKIIKKNFIAQDYVHHLLSTIPKGMKFSQLKVVLDCANGSAYKIAPQIFENIGIDLILEAVNPNGKNINQKCGALYPKKLSKLVIKNKADLGISFDGDSDRLVLCDKNGEILNGDKILAIAGSSMLKQNKLKNKAIVSTKMANIGLKDYLQQRGINLFVTDVGDRYVMNEMKKQNINLGGEQSGHLIFSDHSFTGDGILSALQIFTILQIENKQIHELLEDFRSYPQKLTNIGFNSNSEKILNNKRLLNFISENVNNNRDDLQILIRKSGTEDLLRVMVQSRSNQLTKNISKQLIKKIKEIDER